MCEIDRNIRKPHLRDSSDSWLLRKCNSHTGLENIYDLVILYHSSARRLCPITAGKASLSQNLSVLSFILMGKFYIFDRFVIYPFLPLQCPNLVLIQWVLLITWRVASLCICIIYVRGIGAFANRFSVMISTVSFSANIILTRVLKIRVIKFNVTTWWRGL